MLSIEQEPIRLPPIQNEAEVPEGRLVIFTDHRKLLMPRRFQFLWDQTRIGASIYDLCLRLRARGETTRVFLEVASYLCFLVDHDLIDDLRMVRLADSIRGEYEWPSDVLSTLRVSGEIATWARRAQPRVPWTSRSFDFLSSVFVILSIPFTALLAGLLFDSEARPTASWILFFVAGFGFAGVVGRTGVAVFRSFASNIAGDAGELRWVMDPLGPHLYFKPHTVTGAFRRATDFALCFGVVTIPLALILFVQSLGGRWAEAAPPNSWSLMLMGALFLSALSTHPATRSQLTESLRVWNRTPTVWREDDELREVEFFHRIGGFVSVVLAALYIGQIITASFQLAASNLAASFQTGTAILFFTLFIFTLAIYVEPFLRHELPGSSKRNRRRRLWATRLKILSVAAADRELWNELPVLRQLTAPLRRQLVGAARVVQFKPGVSICRQGDTDRSLYIVLEGKLGVAKSFEGRRRKVVAILSAGAAFGETAFFFGSPRTADVVAMESSRLLEIPYLHLMKDLDLSSSDEFQFRVWLLQALSGNAMLKELPSEAMDTLIFAGTRKTFRAGEAIFTEGAPASECYFIAQGRASVLQGGRKISEMGAGDAFGEIALLKPGSRRTASVVADSDLLCMELQVDSFWALLAARLPLGTEVERLAIRRLKADDDRRARGE